MRVCVYTVKHSEALHTCKIYQACVCEHHWLCVLPACLCHSFLCGYNYMRIGNDLKTFPLIWNHTESQPVFTGASPVIQSKTLLLTTQQQATEQQEAQGWDGGEAGNAWERKEERRTRLGYFRRVDDRRLARWVWGELAVNLSEIDRRTFDPSSAVLILLFFCTSRSISDTLSLCSVCSSLLSHFRVCVVFFSVFNCWWPCGTFLSPRSA